jgi:serine/threonine-protein kinase
MVGKTVAQYQLLEKLGAGGMGEIYKAQDTRLHRFVAIKVLPSAKSGDPERRKRFLQEAQAASGLNHPSIIIIHDIISDGDTEYMVMEYVAGKTLNDLIPKGGLRVPQALKYATQIADALATAHTAGIVHRDLKPANVMVTESGLVKVLDFGLAKLTDRNPVTQIGEEAETIATNEPLTVEGSILGTVCYMSPEQAQGKKIDTRSDIFSFGAVLYEMLTGSRAFDGESSLSTLSAILRDDVKPIMEVAPDVPARLDDVIHQCLKKNPDDRYQTMKEVFGVLSAIKKESDSGALYATGARPAMPTAAVAAAGAKGAAAAGAAAKVAAEPAKKSNTGMIIAVVAGLLVVAGGGGVFFMRQKAAQEQIRKAAEEQAKAEAAAAEAQKIAEAAAQKAAEAAMKEDGALNNDAIVEMATEGVPARLILSQIFNATKTQFDLGPKEIIRLTKAGIGPVIIEQMRDPKKPMPVVPPTQTAANMGNQQKQAPATPGGATPTPAVPAIPRPNATPTAVPINGSPTMAEIPAVSARTPASTGSTASVSIGDALPFRIATASDIRQDAALGSPLKFTVIEDFKVNGITVVPKGASVYGEITLVPGGKKFVGAFGGGAKLSFKLTRAEAAGGNDLAVRALGARRSDGPTQRPVETNTKSGSKDIAAMQGTEYIAYVDGAQTLNLPH